MILFTTRTPLISIADVYITLIYMFLWIVLPHLIYLANCKRKKKGGDKVNREEAPHENNEERRNKKFEQKYIYISKIFFSYNVTIINELLYNKEKE